MPAKATVTQAVRVDRQRLHRLETEVSRQGLRPPARPQPADDFDPAVREGFNLLLLHRRQRETGDDFPDGGERAVLALMS